jgi:hypothetical protein
MGARLSYAKVIDSRDFYVRGGKVHPALPNFALIDDDPGPLKPLLILRGWTDDHGTFTEQWKIESPGGTILYESVPRELHLASPEHVENLEDEVADLEVDYAADDYSVLFLLDDREVARVDFPVLSEAPNRDNR